MPLEAEYLIAHSSAPEVWNDPSEDLLFILFQDIARGDLEFLIVDRVDSPTTYVQTAQCGSYCGHDGGDWWTVERREGSADSHWRTCINGLSEAHEVLSSWATNAEPRGQEFADLEWTKQEF